MTRILIADDHPLFRLALKQALQSIAPEATLFEAESLGSARTRLESDPELDLLLLDLHLPDGDGLMGLASFRAEFPSVAVVMISASEDPAMIRSALALGAAGYIPKRASLDELGHALSVILACESFVPDDIRAMLEQLPEPSADERLAERLAALTPQQFRVLGLVAEGKLNKQIADRLGIQERTIKAHLSLIFQKLGVRNRTQASVLLRSLGTSGRPAG